MSDGKKRARASNYTADEKLLLLNIIAKYKNVVENKKTDAFTWRQKEDCWLVITKQFNASSRSVESLKGFYENLKHLCHKKAAITKWNVCGTGGGPSSNAVADPIFDLTMSIINNKTVFGLNSPYGGDINCLAESSTTTVDVIAFKSDICLLNNVVEDNNDQSPEEDDVENDRNNPDVLVQRSDIQEEHCYSDAEAMDWTKHTAKDLQKPIHKKLINPNNYCKIKGDVKNVQSPTNINQTPTHSKATNAWSGRRRPAMNASISVSRKYEELCNFKQKLVQTQLRICEQYEKHQTQILQLEIQDRQLKREREEKLFKLDMDIRQAQLQCLRK